MRVVFLGTGTSSGVPQIACKCRVCQSNDSKDKRLRSSVFVEVQGFSFLIDIGPDFRQQILRENIEQLDGIFITHGHRDHTGGLDDIRGFNFSQKKAMDIFLDAQARESLVKQYDYVFDSNSYAGIPRVCLHTIFKEAFFFNGIQIQPIEVMHNKLPIRGFRLGDFTYITDANYISPKEKEKIKGSKIFVLNALRREPHISHFTLEQAINLAQEIGAEHTYLTHIGHQMGLHRDISKQLPCDISLAYDGLNVLI